MTDLTAEPPSKGVHPHQLKRAGGASLAPALTESRGSLQALQLCAGLPGTAIST